MRRKRVGPEKETDGKKLLFVVALSFIVTGLLVAGFLAIWDSWRFWDLLSGGLLFAVGAGLIVVAIKRFIPALLHQNEQAISPPEELINGSPSAGGDPAGNVFGNKWLRCPYCGTAHREALKHCPSCGGELPDRNKVQASEKKEEKKEKASIDIDLEQETLSDRRPVMILFLCFAVFMAISLLVFFINNGSIIILVLFVLSVFFVIQRIRGVIYAHRKLQEELQKRDHDLDAFYKGVGMLQGKRGSGSAPPKRQQPEYGNADTKSCPYCGVKLERDYDNCPGCGGGLGDRK